MAASASTILTGSLLLSLLLAPSPAQARAGNGGRLEPGCPLPDGLAAPRLHRQVYWIEEEPEGITLAHSSNSWGEPAEVWLKGLQLVAVKQRPGGELVAQVRVSGRLAQRLGCRGEHQLRGGDALATSLRVVSVLRSGLLLERGDQLAFLRAPGARAARWFLAFSVPGTVVVPEGHEMGLGLRGRYRHVNDY